MEYKVVVLTEPHPWDNKTAPYFWCILKSGPDGDASVNNGWATSPERAFSDAMSWVRAQK